MGTSKGVARRGVLGVLALVLFGCFGGEVDSGGLADTAFGGDGPMSGAATTGVTGMASGVGGSGGSGSTGGETGGGCVDADGDGFGTNCEAGPDCDDANGCVWTEVGCATCVDTDNDGVWVGCDVYGECSPGHVRAVPAGAQQLRLRHALSDRAPLLTPESGVRADPLWARCTLGQCRAPACRRPRRRRSSLRKDGERGCSTRPRFLAGPMRPRLRRAQVLSRRRSRARAPARISLGASSPIRFAWSESWGAVRWGSYCLQPTWRWIDKWR